MHVERSTTVRSAPDGDVEIVNSCFRIVQNNNWKIFLGESAGRGARIDHAHIGG